MQMTSQQWGEKFLPDLSSITGELVLLDVRGKQANVKRFGTVNGADLVAVLTAKVIPHVRDWFPRPKGVLTPDSVAQRQYNCWIMLVVDGVPVWTESAMYYANHGSPDNHWIAVDMVYVCTEYRQDFTERYQEALTGYNRHEGHAERRSA